MSDRYRRLTRSQDRSSTVLPSDENPTAVRKTFGRISRAELVRVTNDYLGIDSVRYSTAVVPQTETLALFGFAGVSVVFRIARRRSRRSGSWFSEAS